MSDGEILKHLFEEFCANNVGKNYDLEMWQYDGSTNQFFVKSVGDFAREDMLELQAFLRNGVKKVLVNEVLT